MTLNKDAQAATKHANRGWIEAVNQAIDAVSKLQETFTTNDVLRYLEEHCQARTKDLRAIGGLMVDARRRGVIESRGLVRRNDKHSRAATTLWARARRTAEASDE